MNPPNFLGPIGSNRRKKFDGLTPAQQQKVLAHLPEWEASWQQWEPQGGEQKPEGAR